MFFMTTVNVRVNIRYIQFRIDLNWGAVWILHPGTEQIIVLHEATPFGFVHQDWPSWVQYTALICTWVLYSCYYMSPPAGDIYCFSLRVCPSVRLSVTLSCPSHISKNLSCKKFAKKSKNNILTEVVHQKLKIQFCQKFWKFWPKKHFLNFRFVQARSQ